MKNVTLASIIIVVFISIISSCSQKQTLESRVKKYMQDSVVTGFNDPKSYEWVSMEKPDSIFIHEVALNNISRDSSKLTSENLKFSLDKLEFTNYKEDAANIKDITDSHNHIVSILEESIKSNKSYLSRPDSLINVTIKVNFRAKNAMGALVVNNVNLSLDPTTNILSANSN